MSVKSKLLATPHHEPTSHMSPLLGARLKLDPYEGDGGRNYKPLSLNYLEHRRYKCVQSIAKHIQENTSSSYRDEGTEEGRVYVLIRLPP